MSEAEAFEAKDRQWKQQYADKFFQREIRGRQIQRDSQPFFDDFFDEKVSGRERGLSGEFTQKPLDTEKNPMEAVFDSSAQHVRVRSARFLLKELDPTRATLPVHVRSVIMNAKYNENLDRTSLFTLRSFLLSECGHGTEEFGNPVPAIQAYRYHLPLRVQAIVFDERTREICDNAARLCGLLEVPGDEEEEKKTDEEEQCQGQLKPSSVDKIDFTVDDPYTPLDSVGADVDKALAKAEQETAAFEKQREPLPSLFDYLDEYLAAREKDSTKAASGFDRFAEDKMHLEQMIANFNRRDIPGIDRDNNIERAIAHGYDPIAWLRWLFVAALRHNVDTEFLHTRLKQIFDAETIRRLYANANFQLDVRAAVRDPKYTRGVPSWAARWIDDAGDSSDSGDIEEGLTPNASEVRRARPDVFPKPEEAQETLPSMPTTSYTKTDPLFEGLIDEIDSYTTEEEETQEVEEDIEDEASEEGASPSKKTKTDMSEAPEDVLNDRPERIWRLVTNLQKDDISSLDDPIAWLRWLLVQAVQKNLNTEPLFSRLRMLFPHDTKHFVDRVFNNAYFKEDLKSALQTYTQARPSWIARVDPEGTLKLPEQQPSTSQSTQVAFAIDDPRVYEGWLKGHGQNAPNADPLSYAREMMFGPTLEQRKNARKEYRNERRRREELEIAQGIRQPKGKRRTPYDSRYSGETFRGAYMTAGGMKMRPGNDALNGLDSWTFRQRLREERRLGPRETIVHRGRFAHDEAERKAIEEAQRAAEEAERQQAEMLGHGHFAFDV